MSDVCCFANNLQISKYTWKHSVLGLDMFNSSVLVFYLNWEATTLSQNKERNKNGKIKKEQINRLFGTVEILCNNLVS